MPISAKNEESLLSCALKHYNSGKFNSIASVAAYFGVSKLRNRKNGILTKKGSTPTNKALNDS
ncbi:hypothetical protein PITC_094950 [Penicillium italicum]|uniref:DNA binding HTH domain, Psq-type n=1 Tax=Penicillium italicum TaxID=40296 RepID=A0A0A2KQW3_PENIT|nr:hypothetical protein PITC_094950 [Penicillium italicum]